MGESQEEKTEPSAESVELSGDLLAAISTNIVQTLREHYGRGPMRAKTYVLDDLIVCVLKNGFTAIEQTMMDTGSPDRVVAMRRDFQEMIGEKYRDIIERLTGRKVTAFLSQAHIEPDITIEAFLVDEPLEVSGAVELVEPA
jgi:uncharacterized protein YbcI